MDTLAFLTLPAFVIILMRLLALAFGRDWDGVVKTVASWTVAVVAVLFYAHTSQGETLVINDVTLGSMDAWDQVLLGLGLGSVAGVAFLGLKAVDRTQSAAQPTIVQSRDADAQHP